MKQSLPRPPPRPRHQPICVLSMDLPLLGISYTARPLHTNPWVENFAGRPSGMYWREQPWRARGPSLLMKGGSSSTWGPGGRGEPLSQGQYPCNTSIFCTVNVIIIIIFCISIKLSCSFHSQLILKKKFLESPQLTGSMGS